MALDVSAFTVGEEINPADSNVRVRITAIHSEENTLEAIVIKAEGYFSEGGGGFKKGMELIFLPRWPGMWVPRSKKSLSLTLPWFELLILPIGEKIFMHYR